MANQQVHYRSPYNWVPKYHETIAEYEWILIELLNIVMDNSASHDPQSLTKALTQPEFYCSTSKLSAVLDQPVDKEKIPHSGKSHLRCYLNKKLKNQDLKVVSCDSGYKLKLTAIGDRAV